MRVHGKKCCWMNSGTLGGVSLAYGSRGGGVEDRGGGEVERWREEAVTSGMSHARAYAFMVTSATRGE